MKSLLVVALLLGTSGVAAAQTFTYAKPEDVPVVPAVDWAGSAEAGFLFTTGNSRTTTLTAGGKLIRLAAKNKLAAEAGLAFAQSTVLVAADLNGNGSLSENEIETQTLTTANTWFGKLRYDRFLTEHNSLYAAALVARDVPAGKEVSGGGQIGYSRQLYKTTQHEIVSEVGYDLSYEDLVGTDPVVIHSLRLFVGYTGTLSADTGVTASLESLSNVNTLDTVPDEATAFEDTRINAGAGVTTKLGKTVSLSFSIGIKFDNQPAPRAAFPLPYEAGFVPLASKTDTLTKASLIIALF